MAQSCAFLLAFAAATLLFCTADAAPVSICRRCRCLSTTAFCRPGAFPPGIVLWPPQIEQVRTVGRDVPHCPTDPLPDEPPPRPKDDPEPDDELFAAAQVSAAFPPFSLIHS